MSTVERPGLWNFIKAKLIPFAGSSEYIMSRNGSVKYKERRKTVRLSYFLYITYLFIIISLNQTEKFRIHNVMDFLWQLVLFYAVAFLLESVHWFFAKFDRVKA
jgi:hypothetical protein